MDDFEEGLINIDRGEQILEEVNIRILQIDEEEPRSLDLSGLSIKNDHIEAVIAHIIRVKPDITSLDLDNNDLSNLPNNINNLELQNLSLDGNNFTHLPDALRELINTEIIAPDYLIISLNHNSLSQDALIWLQHFRRQDGVEVRADELNNVNEVMVSNLRLLTDSDIAFGDIIETILSYGGEYTLGNIDNGIQQKTGSEVLQIFLSSVSLNNNNAFDMEHYGNAYSTIISNVIDPEINDQDFETEMAKIAVCLGNCTTPVKDYLITTRIATLIEENEIPEAILLAKREAIQKEIQITLGGVLSPIEKIEQVQALLNSVYLENSENLDYNPIKIQGDRVRLPSKSNSTEFGFRQLKPDAISAFASQVCMSEVNLEGAQQMIMNNGQYILDPNKIEDIFTKHRIDFGLPDAKSMCLTEFKESIASLSSYKELGAEIHESALLLLDTKAVHQELLDNLRNEDELSFRNISTDLVIAYDNRIKECLAVLNPIVNNGLEAAQQAHPLNDLGVRPPRNERRRERSPSSDGEANVRQRRQRMP